TNPSPSHQATDVSVDADLSWTAGSGATSHDVYFGTDSSPDLGEFIQNQAGITYDPGTMNEDTTYYWRIDEVNNYGTTTGDVWRFTTGTGAPPGEIAFDAVSTGVDGSGDDVLSWSHTIGSGSNRVLVVALANEDGSESDMQISSIKFNGLYMTYVSGSSIFYDPIKVDLYYMLESALPSAGTYTVEITYAGTVSDLIGGAISLVNVKQQAPEAVATNSDGDNNVISTNITTQSNGAWVVDVVAHEKGENFITTTSGMVERWDEDSGAHTGAGSTKPVASAGSTTMSWEFDGGTDAIIHSAAAFAPAP
ncbi:MAG: hypothetical protein KAV87_21615, partial [Desulfobacteraceae bacterium]|nr:hypothetical protein [Desulfobacteraceae bacterium]